MPSSWSFSALLLLILMAASACAADDLVGEPHAHRRDLLQRRRKKRPPPPPASLPAPPPSPPKAKKNRPRKQAKGKKPPPPVAGVSTLPSPSPAPSPTSAPSPSSAPSPTQTAQLAGTNCLDAVAMLSVNNVHRVRHQGAGVAWNAQLASDSTAYAAVLANKDNCKLEHSTPQQRGNAGENLAVYMSTAPMDDTCTAAVNDWYNEVVDYNFNATRPFNDNWYQPNKQIGHFTQLVWIGTTSMGCGMAKGAYRFSNGWTGTCKVIVCRYAPPGNYATDDQFSANVKPAAA